MSVNFAKKTLIAALGVALFTMVGCETGPTLNYDEFAQCLSEVGMVEYGAYWCHNCEIQKDMFGSSFEYVNYVECDPNGKNGQPEVCLDAGIEAYPTWRHPDGREWVGVQTMEKLSQVSGCELPTETSDQPL